MKKIIAFTLFGLAMSASASPAVDFARSETLKVKAQIEQGYKKQKTRLKSQPQGCIGLHVNLGEAIENGQDAVNKLETQPGLDKQDKLYFWTKLEELYDNLVPVAAACQ